MGHKSALHVDYILHGSTQSHNVEDPSSLPRKSIPYMLNINLKPDFISRIAMMNPKHKTKTLTINPKMDETEEHIAL